MRSYFFRLLVAVTAAGFLLSAVADEKPKVKTTGAGGVTVAGRDVNTEGGFTFGLTADQVKELIDDQMDLRKAYEKQIEAISQRPGPRPLQGCRGTSPAGVREPLRWGVTEARRRT